VLFGLREYRGEPHRVEPIGILNDVEFFDDSKGPNVGATVAALQGLGADRKIVLILGGEGKGQDFAPLSAPVARFARAVVLEKQYKDLTHTHLRGMLNSIIFRDGADPLAFMNAIGDLDGGAEALADYFAEKHSRIEAFARSGTFDTVEDDGEVLSETALLASAYAKPRVEQDEVADQDWMELAWILRYECPDLFIEMLLVLRAKARAFDAGRSFEDEGEADDGKVDTSETDRGNATPAAREKGGVCFTPSWPRGDAQRHRGYIILSISIAAR
jgi:hypothetical protein